MKQMYKDLQKQHMKELKEATKSSQEDTKEIRSKGFVSQCLLKVEYQGDTVANVNELQVLLPYSLDNRPTSIIGPPQL